MWEACARIYLEDPLLRQLAKFLGGAWPALLSGRYSPQGEEETPRMPLEGPLSSTPAKRVALRVHEPLTRETARSLQGQKEKLAAI